MAGSKACIPLMTAWKSGGAGLQLFLIGQPQVTLFFANLVQASLH